MFHAEQLELLHATLHAAVQVRLNRGDSISTATEMVLLRTFAKAFREAFPDRRDDVSTTDLVNLPLPEQEAAAKQLEDGMHTHKYEALLSNRLVVKAPREPLSTSSSGSEVTERQIPLDSDHQVAERSWKTNYQGQGDEALLYFLKSSMQMSPNGGEYARYAVLVQSSGTGKSRLVDETAKSIFTIPINIRAPKTLGYPPLDEGPRQFLVESTKSMLRAQTFLSQCAFLTALFAHTMEIVKNIDGHVSNFGLSIASSASAAVKFHALMSHDMRFEQHGQFRRDFYAQVIKHATTLLETASAGKRPSSPTHVVRFETTPVSAEADPNVVSHATSLSELLDTLKTITSGDPLVSTPRLLLVFDEAHDLSEDKEADWSPLTELRRALRQMNGLPAFTLFLSTTGDLFQFTPAVHLDKSARVQAGSLRLLPPFTQTPYDVLYSPVADNEITIEEAASTERIVNLGRPLFGSRYQHGDKSVKRLIGGFASSKLVGLTHVSDEESKNPMLQLAVLSTRIPFDFDPANPLATKDQRTLVEKHMRLCLRVLPDNFAVETQAPSEPLLAEAAERVMRRFDPVVTLSQAVSTSGVSLGSRGEQVAALLLLQAIDKARQSLDTDARVVDLDSFLRELLADPTHTSVFGSHPVCSRDPSEDKPLHEQFKDSKMWFNHFIVVEDFDVLNSEYLWRYLLRGAAIICATSQAGCDIVLPFVFRDGKLGKMTVSAVMIQVKNNKSYSNRIHAGLFDAMDPFDLNVFDENANPLPIIRIVMALAAKTAASLVRHAPIRASTPRGAKTPVNAFTAYDLWLAGTSPDTFKPITPKLRSSYDQVLRLSQRVHVSEEKEDDLLMLLRLGLRAGKGTAPGHWPIIKSPSNGNEDVE